MIPLAISPCPNDTFLFHAWIFGLIDQNFLPVPTYADIDTLNQWALEKRFPLIKVSCSILKKIENNYQLLPVGVTLGYGCGPKIIAKSPFPLESLSTKTVAIPGVETTAHRLLQLLAPSPLKKVVLPYHAICKAVENGEVDCGLIIHETRFTFAKCGLIEIADLGALWEKTHQLPLPLGAIVVSKDLSSDTIQKITDLLQLSLHYAWAYPAESRPFILEKAQEKQWAIAKKHIDLYVTQETCSLSEKGRQAINKLLQ